MKLNIVINVFVSVPQLPPPFSVTDRNNRPKPGHLDESLAEKNHVRQMIRPIGKTNIDKVILGILGVLRFRHDTGDLF